MFVAALAALDWLILAAYMAFVLGLGWYSQRRQSASDDYLMAGRKLPWWAVGLSLIATSFSTLALLGYMDGAYVTGFLNLQLQLGDLLGFTLVAIFFLPFFAGKGMTTAYEYLEERFGRIARRVGSLIFIVSTLARGGALLAATAAAAAVAGELPAVELFGGTLSPVAVGILVVGTLAILYSAMGGLGAVVWTDTLQFALIMVGLGACFFLALGGIEGGWDAVGAEITKPREGPSIGDVSHNKSLITMVLGYGVLALSVAGTNQQSVQRYMACSDIRAARRAIFLGWGAGVVVVALTMLLGITFAVLYEGEAIEKGTNVIAVFIAGEVPWGLAGLVMAAILAAMMSSVDSAMHAMSTATLVDFVEPGRDQPLSDKARLRLARLLTIGYGILLLAAASYAAAQKDNVLDLVLRWLNYILGPLLGLFLLGMWVRRVGEQAALVGVGVGYVLSIALNDPMGWFLDAQGRTPLAHLGLGSLWTAALAMGATVVGGTLASFLWPREDRDADGAGR